MRLGVPLPAGLCGPRRFNRDAPAQPIGRSGTLTDRRRPSSLRTLHGAFMLQGGVLNIEFSCRRCHHPSLMSGTEFRARAGIPGGGGLTQILIEEAGPKVACPVCGATGGRSFVLSGDASIVASPLPAPEPPTKAASKRSHARSIAADHSRKGGNKSPAGAGPTRDSSDAERMLATMLAHPNWLWGRDYTFLRKLPRRDLTARQAQAVRNAFARYKENQLPRIVRG